MLTTLRLHPLPKQRSAGSLLARGVLRLRRISAGPRARPPRSACTEPTQDAAAARLLLAPGASAASRLPLPQQTGSSGWTFSAAAH